MLNIDTREAATYSSFLMLFKSLLTTDNSINKQTVLDKGEEEKTVSLPLL